MARFTQSGGEGGAANTGDITFNGVQIIGAGTASSDGLSAGTMQLVPDAGLDSDQYLIIDPTAPNHIHIRPGGTIDASTADLIMGGENTNLLVSDTGDYVDVRTTSESSTNVWRFNSDGYLTGPAMGGLFVSGILNGEDDLYVQASGDEKSVIINGNGGEFLGNSSTQENQIATIGDISNATPDETSFTVNGGSLGTMPTFTGAPLFSGSYVKTGPLVHFQIQVDMDNITNFGTGQYYVDLPFDAKYAYQVREGCLHDTSTDRQYAIGGHVAAGQSRLNLFFTDSNGQDQEFDHNSPVTLAIADNFHVSGTYISE
jgi:hypothetical protein